MTGQRHRVEFGDEAGEQLRKLDKSARSRILVAIDKLEKNPRSEGVKKLKGQENRWWIRVGDWRVSYQIEDGRLVVLVVAVGHRSKVYKEK